MYFLDLRFGWFWLVVFFQAFIQKKKGHSAEYLLCAHRAHARSKTIWFLGFVRQCFGWGRGHLQNPTHVLKNNDTFTKMGSEGWSTYLNWDRFRMLEKSSVAFIRTPPPPTLQHQTLSVRFSCIQDHQNQSKWSTNIQKTWTHEHISNCHI